MTLRNSSSFYSEMLVVYCYLRYLQLVNVFRVFSSVLNLKYLELKRTFI